jgi:hypothetical protein
LFQVFHVFAGSPAACFQVFCHVFAGSPAACFTDWMVGSATLAVLVQGHNVPLAARVCGLYFCVWLGVVLLMCVC